MPFDMTIAASEFKEKKLKVLASIPLQILVKQDDQLVKELTTKPDQMLYDLSDVLTDDHVVEFYPVVNAL